MHTALLAVVLLGGCALLATGRPQQPFVPILARYEQQEPAGNFRSAYETGNGIHFDETGYLKPTNDGLDQVVAKQGSYSYTSPEGVPVQITYVADELGFQPQGNVIPQPVQPIQPVFTYEFVAAWRPGRPMMNQVVLAHKDARLLKEWLDGYRDYRPDLWYFNAGRQPGNVLLQKPYLIHSVPDLLGTYDMRPKIYLKSWPEWRLYYSCHLMVRWMNNFRGVSYPSPLRAQDVLRLNNTFREMVDDVYDLSRLSGG